MIQNVVYTVFVLFPNIGNAALLMFATEEPRVVPNAPNVLFPSVANPLPIVVAPVELLLLLLIFTLVVSNGLFAESVKNTEQAIVTSSAPNRKVSLIVVS